MQQRVRAEPGPLIDPHARRTGGWRWHGRALRYSALWSEARSAIAQWLNTVPQPLPPRLVWVGASAGWMMPTAWLLRFRQVEIVDLDPLCTPLLGVRHGWPLARAQVRWQVHRVDVVERLDDVLERWPDAILFFDNVLGQQRYRYSDGEALDAWLNRLRDRLSGRRWGSVHDWLSGPVVGQRGAALPGVLSFRMGDRGPLGCGSACIESASTALAEGLLEQVGARGDWQDHLTGRVFPVGTQGVLIPWRFSSTHLHWLQAAWVDGCSDTQPGVPGHRLRA